MSAEVLREAAALMRSRAKAATKGPWEDRSHRDYGWVALYLDESSIDEGESLPSMEAGGSATTADAAHIASWHPDVALAVADWLDDWARVMEANTASGAREPGCHPKHPALAVANAYLGRTP